MNDDQMKGSARYTGGKIEGGVGDLIGDRDLQNEGLIDQVKGAAHNFFGDVKDSVRSTYDRASPVAINGVQQAISATRQHTVLAVLAAGAVGYALAWAFHGNEPSAKNY